MDTEIAHTDKAQLLSDIKGLIIESVNLKHRDPASMNENTSLMEGGLELDSIDILEIVVAVEQRFNVKIKDGEDGKRVFRTLGTIADFVHSQKK